MVKIALIMYMFEIALMFGGYLVNEASGMELFSLSNYDALKEIMDRNEVNEEDDTLNLDLIFGDFTAGARILFGILTGETMGSAFTQLPNFDEIWIILFRLVYTTSAAFLWIYVIAGRVL